MSRLTFKPLHGPWTAGKHGPYTDETTVENPAAELVKAAAGAHAAGAIDVTEGLDAKHVQSQASGEKAYAAAQADGSWQHGHLLQHELDEAQKTVAGLEQAIAELGDELSHDRAGLQMLLDEAVAEAAKVSADVWKRARKGPA